MEVVNRHYIMTRIMGRTSVLDHLKLLVLQAFGLASLLSRPRAWSDFPGIAGGKLTGLIDVLRGKSGRSM